MDTGHRYVVPVTACERRAARRNRRGAISTIVSNHKSTDHACANEKCHTSESAAAQLASHGYVNVRDYPGGKHDWVTARLPLERGAAPEVRVSRLAAQRRVRLPAQRQSTTPNQRCTHR